MSGKTEESALLQNRRSLPIALWRAREKVMSPYRDLLAVSGVNEQKWRVLRVREEYGAMALTHLADATCLLLSSLQRMIARLEAEEMVQRPEANADRRKVILDVTRAGRGLIHRRSAQSAGIAARIELGFGRDRLELLLDLPEDLQKQDLRPRA